MAQPSWVKKASKSVLTLKTFADDGTLIGSSNAFFVSEGGEAVASFTPFKSASRAVVIDVAGKEYPVECVLGANETYDVAKFRVGIKKCVPLVLAKEALKANDKVWLLSYREQKKALGGMVRKAEQFQSSYTYYTVSMQTPANCVGAPLMTDDGRVVGLMQQPATASDTLSYAVSAVFADSLRMSGLSINDPALRSVRIKKALPADLGQAQLTLFVGGSSLDSADYVSLAKDFIAQFPQVSDGYVSLARLYANGRNYADADLVMEEGMKQVEKKDELHYSYSQMVYQKEVYAADVPYAPWSFDKALQEAREAYAVNPMPGYQHQEAYVLFAMKNYQDAARLYDQLATTNLRSSELFFEASRCHAMMGDTLRQLALLDSAVAVYSRPYLREAAPYLLARGRQLIEVGRYRDGVNDLNDYEELMKTQVNSNFYYLRFQAEVEGRLFQQALNDINRAISMSPDNDLYYSEKASLLVRVGMYDDAIMTANQMVSQFPTSSDGYLFLGLAQSLKGQKAEGLKNLQKAKDMGDPQAEGLIEKYSK